MDIGEFHKFCIQYKVTYHIVYKNDINEFEVSAYNWKDWFGAIFGKEECFDKMADKIRARINV